MITLEHVTKRYNTRQGPHLVLDDVTCHFPAGESVGILGRNGAGKSTLLRILGGAEQPDEGRVVRKGKISWPIGFAGGFNSSLSGEENCRFVARIYDVPVDYVVDFARHFAEVGKHFTMPVRTYSSGMRARLAFGLSMALDFDLYLVDEITAVGDSDFQAKCRKAFEERQAHSAVIMVSHQLKTIRQYCQRCAVLKHGRLKMFDSVDQAELFYRENAA